MLNIIENLKDGFIQISNLLRNSNLLEISDEVENINYSGDSVKKIDKISNDILKEKLKMCQNVKYISSEEEENILLNNSCGEYLVSFDPIDGSSNIKSNITTGSIFCIFKCSPTSFYLTWLSIFFFFN